MPKFRGLGSMTSLRVPLLVALVLVCALGSATGAAADSGSTTYQYLIGTGGTTSPPFGPDVAMASNGSTVTITGSGTFSVPAGPVSGSGPFVEKNSAGQITASGTWTATRLLSFVSYGNGTPQGLPPNTFGGEALIQVQLSTGPTAVLDVTCLLGNPPAGKHEGVRLAVTGGPNFNQQVSGETVFIQP